MANICENELRVYSEDSKNLEYITNFIEDNLDVSNVYEDEEILTINFYSKWYFPESIMDELYEGIPNKKDVSMVCFSVEWGNFYSAFHICDSEGWVLE